MKTNLSHFTDIHGKVQKLRVATGNRIAHLAKQDRRDDRAENIHQLTASLEETVEKYIAEDFVNHPTYPWVSRIKGCGKEASAKPIGIIEGVTFKGVLLADLNGNGVKITKEELRENYAELELIYPDVFRRRSGIYAFDTPSRLRRFAGLAPVDNKSEKIGKGQKLIHYSPELRMMLWRLLTSLMRARGVWYEQYLENDRYYTKRYEDAGIKIIPTPQGRYCVQCGVEKEVNQTTRNCPECGEPLSAKIEMPGVIFRGHVVNMAKRRAIRLWLDCLWLVWREALHLSTRTPYSVEYQGHHLIDPWQMVDR